MPQIVPLKPVPSQTLQVVLDGQSCIVNVNQLDYGLFVDIKLSNEFIVAGSLALNNNKLIRDTIAQLGSPGFSGDFAFEDLNGTGQDPIYTGIGSQFQLFYFFDYELVD